MTSSSASEPPSLLHSAARVASGRTIGAPDEDRVFAEVEALFAGCQTRSVVASDHLRTAARYLLTTAQWDSKGERAHDAAIDQKLASRMKSAARVCVEQEQRALSRLAALQMCRQSLVNHKNDSETRVQDVWDRGAETPEVDVSQARREWSMATARHEGELKQLLTARSLLNPSTVAEDVIEDDVGNNADTFSGVNDSNVVMAAQQAHEQDLASIRCPITGTDMQVPVRNRDCLHTYDRSSIEQLIRNTNRLRLSVSLTDAHVAPCPVAGCRSTVRISSLEPDIEVALARERVERRRIRLRSRRERQHEAPETSRDSIEDEE